MFGELLKALRQSRNLTLRELGRKTDMDHIVLNKIELGLRMPPPLDGILAIADALDLDEKEFERLLDEAAVENGQSSARFTPDALGRIKASRAAQAFFTRRVRDKED